MRSEGYANFVKVYFSRQTGTIQIANKVDGSLHRLATDA
jgi:hypothetical protein